MDALYRELLGEGIMDVKIIAIDGAQFGNGPAQIAGMAAGHIAPLAQENAQQPIWGPWNVVWRDVFILNRNGYLVSKINLTGFDPDPSVNNGQNYAQLKNMLLDARNQ